MLQLRAILGESQSDGVSKPHGTQNFLFDDELHSSMKELLAEAIGNQ